MVSTAHLHSPDFGLPESADSPQNAGLLFKLLFHLFPVILYNVLIPKSEVKMVHSVWALTPSLVGN